MVKTGAQRNRRELGVNESRPEKALVMGYLGKSNFEVVPEAGIEPATKGL